MWKGKDSVSLKATTTSSYRQFATSPSKTKILEGTASCRLRETTSETLEDFVEMIELLYNCPNIRTLHRIGPLGQRYVGRGYTCDLFAAQFTIFCCSLNSEGA